MRPVSRLACAAVFLTALVARADVIAKNGNFLWIETDLTDPANPELKVVRAYNSKSPFVGMFGLGWGYPWGSYVEAPDTVHDWGGGQTVAGALFSVEGPLRVRAAGDGSKQLFDSSGQLVEIRGPGHDTKIARGTDGLIESITDGRGHRLSLKWGPPGRVVELSGAGGVVDYRYDEAGLLTYVKQSDGQELRYTYDGAGRGNLIRIEFPDGSSQEIDYYDRALNENVRQVKERDGKITRYDYTWDPAHPGFSHVDVVEAAGHGKPETRRRLDFTSPEGGARPSWGSAKPTLVRGLAPQTAAEAPAGRTTSRLPLVFGLIAVAAAVLMIALKRKR